MTTLLGSIAQGAAGGSSGLPSERWWRIRCPVLYTGNGTGTGSTNYVDFFGIHMSLTPGGPNIAHTATDWRCSVAGNEPRMKNMAANPPTGSWDNWGIHVIGDNFYGAYKLPTAAPINEVRIRSGGSYSPFIIIVESSWDGEDWEFEWGYTHIGWQSTSTFTSFPRRAIDWDTYAARDWIVTNYKSNNYDNFGVTEMEMASVAGGPDLTGPGQGTPRSTGNGTYPASNLTDNNVDSLCGNTGPGKRAYVGYTFNEPKIVNELRFRWHGNESLNWGCLSINPRPGGDGTFDGGSPGWYIKALLNGVRSVGWGVWTTHDVRRSSIRPDDHNPHRYWRVRPTEVSQGSEFTLFVIQELRFFKNGANITVGGTPMSSGGAEHGGPAGAFNGFTGPITDNNQRWATTQLNQYRWLGYDFGAPVLPDALTIWNNNEGNSWSRTVHAFELDWSDDGNSWYPKKGFRHPWTAPGESFTWQIPQ